MHDNRRSFRQMKRPAHSHRPFHYYLQQISAAIALPRKVGEGLVGVGHAMRILARLHCLTFLAEGSH